VQQASNDVENFLTNGTFVVDPDAAIQRVVVPKATKRDFAAYFSKWENMKVLIGTSWSWFALDIAFYGLSLNSSIILNAIHFGSPSSSITGSLKAYTTFCTDLACVDPGVHIYEGSNKHAYANVYQVGCIERGGMSKPLCRLLNH
ncbi:hypothetical protein EW145_g4743, partial [Phellinidium pouzarii]